MASVILLFSLHVALLHNKGNSLQKALLSSNVEQGALLETVLVHCIGELHLEASPASLLPASYYRLKEPAHIFPLYETLKIGRTLLKSLLKNRKK